MKQIIGFTGKMHAGKTTAMEYIIPLLEKRGFYPRCIKFAQPLYDMQQYIYERAGLPPVVKDRKLLQYLGTEWGRGIAPDLWINLWRTGARLYLLQHTPNIVLCDDVRFDNEAEQIIKMGGAVVAIAANAEDCAARSPATSSGLAHPSEKGVDPELVTYLIDNSQDLPHFKDQLKTMLERL